GEPHQCLRSCGVSPVPLFPQESSRLTLQSTVFLNIIWILVRCSNGNTCYPRADLGGGPFKSGEIRRKLFPTNPFEQEESTISK
ncbi:hypothetical protein ABEV54_19640, partial [Peribacillus psychrosaccharolyticus]|uniref:hypothetical protein n=1 Tax=Peribacillus psychrosaccharolyticus TaxID=1407 RepID=UPI003D28B40D